jgi:cytochrome c oxidase subunit III
MITKQTTPTLEERSASETSRMGMGLFLVALGVLFASCLLGYLVVWYRAQVWGNPIGESLPHTLWLSTALLIAGSLTHHRALSAVRADRGADLRLWLGITLWLGAAFLACQGYCWYRLIEINLPPNTKNLYAFGFYVLTTLHALHVVGGLVGLFVVWYRASKGVYSARKQAAVWRSAVYWHFLDAVWIVLFVTLLWTVK